MWCPGKARGHTPRVPGNRQAAAAGITLPTTHREIRALTCNLSRPSQYTGQIGSNALDSHADVCKAARGDHQAFGRIVEAYQGRIFAYLGRMGIDRTTAEDIAQDTFLRVWRNAGQFNPKRGSLVT